MKNAGVTLTGEVSPQQLRDDAGELARRVPNVKEVVNDLQVTNRKASSSR